MYSTLHRYKIFHILGRNLLTERFLPFKWLYKLFQKVSWSTTISRNGISYKVFIKGGVGTMNFVPDFEPWMDTVLPKLLGKKDDVFFDVGANIGQTMIKVLSRFPDTQYFAVEPNDHCVKYIKELAELNNFKSVTTLEYALSDFIGETNLLLRYRDDLLATTTTSFRKFTKYAIEKTVKVTRGDVLISTAKLDKISIIKMDVEGGEPKVLEGLLESIRAFQPYIISEILPLNTENDGVTEFRKSSARQMLSRLKEEDYTVFNLITSHKVGEIDDLSISLESCNYIFVPQMKLNEFMA